MLEKIQNRIISFGDKDAPRVRRNFSVFGKKPTVAEDGSVRLVLTTERPVVRYHINDEWELEEFDEVLSMDPEHLRAERLDAGAVPMLDAHWSWVMEDQIGAISGWSIEGTKLLGDYLPRSNQKSQEIYKDVISGIVRNVSIGYIVYRYMDVTPDESRRKIFRAIDWEIFEASFVPVGADLDAGVRAMSSNRQILERSGEKFVIINKPLERGENMLAKKKDDQTNNPQPEQLAASAVSEADTKAAVEAAKIAERTRVSEISSVCRKFKVDESRKEQFIEKGTSAEEVRKTLIDEMELESESRAVPSTLVTISRDEGDTFRQSVRSSILNKIRPDLYQLEANGRAYREMSALDLCRHICEKNGVKTFGMRKEEVIKRAFMSGSDLPAIFLDAMNKSLLKAYKEKPQSFEHFVSRVSHSDFKLQNKVRLGDAPSLEEISENGEVKYGALKDSKEAFRLKTFGRGLKIGERMFIDDDLSALESVPAGWGRKVRQLESKLVYDLLLSNPTMGDGVALFHASHGNLFTTNTDISVATVGAGEKLLITQKDLDNEEINLEASHMLVPAARKVEAQQFLSGQFIPTKAADVNPFRGNIQLKHESRLDASSATRYYLTADKDQVDMMQLATLDGRGPEVTSESDFDTDGMKTKIKYHVAAGLVDYRGFVWIKGA